MSTVCRGASIVDFLSSAAVTSFPLPAPLLLRHRRNNDIFVNKGSPPMLTARKLKLGDEVGRANLMNLKVVINFSPEMDPKSSVALRSTMRDSNSETEPKSTDNKHEKEKSEGESRNKMEQKEEKIEQEHGAKYENVPVETEPKTGVSFPIKVSDGKKLVAVGLRKKSMLGLGIKIYAFGIYTDNEKLEDLLSRKFGKAPFKATREMYQKVIDSDFGMMVRMVIVFPGLTMSMVRKNFDESLGASIKKLTGKKNDELTKMIMGEASNGINLTPGSVIEISRLPGYTLQTKVMDEVVSTVESKLLCRAYMHMYLGEDPFDKEAKEKFGTSMLSLF